MKRYKIVLAFFSLAFISCAAIKPVNNTLLTSKIISEINYKKNRPYTVYVGESMVKVKLYTLDIYNVRYLKASADFNIQKLNLSGKKGQIFEVIGTVDYIQKKHYIIALPTKSKGRIFSLARQSPRHIGYLIDKSGTASGTIVNLVTGSYIKGTFPPNPQTLTFHPTLNKRINKKSDFLNYEIIYTGTDGTNLFFTYQEYSLNDVRKPEFDRELKYSKNMQIIRYKNTTLKVHKANNERISYTVIEDSLHRLM